MKKSVLIVALVTAAVLATACGDDRNKLRRDQQQYDVVEEGAGGTVSSTLQVPGEPTPLPPLTGTNADTTTAFTLPAMTDSAQSGPPGTIAGTFTTGSGSTHMPSKPSTRPAPRPAPTPVPARDPEPAPVPPTTTTQEPPDQPEPEPEPQPEPQPQPPPTLPSSSNP